MGGGNASCLFAEFVLVKKEEKMKGMNRVMLIGHLGKDPELRYTKKGTPVTNLSIATNYTFKDDSGTPQEQTEWHNVVVWGKQAEVCQQFLNKGRLVYAEGRLVTREWNDSEGKPKKTKDIMASTVRFLDSKKQD